MTRVAAIDCGTNSIRLLIADAPDVPDSPHAQGDHTPLVDVVRRMEVVRLGQGVDRTGRIAPKAMARTLAMTREYAAQCRAAGVERVRFVATSATRDASNREEFVVGVREALGVEPEVVTGHDEAALSFRGATTSLRGRHSDPFLVVDLGGGSTELVLGRGGRVEASRSLDIGCVRLTERHLAASPPEGPVDAKAVAAIRADVEAALDDAARDVPLSRARTLVGVAGTVTTVTAHALGLSRYDPEVLHGSDLPVDVVVAACDDLIAMSRPARGALPYMHPGRVDVICAGALIWRTVVLRVAAVSGLERVVTSEHDILDGIAAGLVGQRA